LLAPKKNRPSHFCKTRLGVGEHHAALNTPRSDQLERRRKLAHDWSNFCSQIGNAALIT
jgi:hypothetical protein